MPTPVGLMMEPSGPMDLYVPKDATAAARTVEPRQISHTAAVASIVDQDTAIICVTFNEQSTLIRSTQYVRARKTAEQVFVFYHYLCRRV